MITIRMPTDLLNKWLTALESGKYNQTQMGFLEYDGGYCCLGVLQMEADGEVEQEPQCIRANFPSHQWLKEHGVEFNPGDGDFLTTPWLPSLSRYAHEANDSGASFQDIAAAIRECSEGT